MIATLKHYSDIVLTHHLEVYTYIYICGTFILTFFLAFYLAAHG